MILSHIVATDLNGAIGKDNKLPWHLPEDLKFFKATTQGKVMIMGRKTFESIGRLLPGRFHIVVSRQVRTSDNPLLKFVSSLDEAIKLAQTLIGEWPEEVFILGGGEIFAQSMGLVDRIYLTKIEKVVEGDCFYPDVDFSKFNIDKEDHFQTSEKFTIRRYCRKDHQ
jgi:dihydrofolate reductase